MSVFRCRDERLVKGRAHSIVEYDDKGNIIGTYTGYYNPDFRSVTLYPDYRHPGLKPGVKLRKQRIYDGSVSCQMRNEKSEMRNGGQSLSQQSRQLPLHKGAEVKSATAGLRQLPFVQERMKF